MKGTVRIFNVGIGIGFIDGADGKEYFVHESQIRSMASILRVLMPGWEIEFEPRQGAKGLEAWNITTPAGNPGIVVNDLQSIKLANDKVVRLVVGEEEQEDSGGTTIVPWVTVEGVDIPHMEAENFAAYPVSGKFEWYKLEAPMAMADAVYLVLNRDKVPQIDPLGQYTVPPRSYYAVVRSSGYVEIMTLGRRWQQDMGQNWATIERRFVHCYDFSPGAPSLEEQTPTSGKDRDNDGFIPAIRAAREVMATIAETE